MNTVGCAGLNGTIAADAEPPSENSVETSAAVPSSQVIARPVPTSRGDLDSKLHFGA